MCQNRAPAGARIAIPRAHTGHGVRNTNWPLWKIFAGYLNRSSIMDLRQRHAAIRIGTCLKEIGVTKCLVSAGKSTGRKPSLVEKDTTAEFRSSLPKPSMADVFRPHRATPAPAPLTPSALARDTGPPADRRSIEMMP